MHNLQWEDNEIYNFEFLIALVLYTPVVDMLGEKFEFNRTILLIK